LTTLNKIITSIQSNEEMLQNEFVLSHLFVFGSYARNEQTINSDLDLFYEVKPGTHMTLGRLKRLENAIKKITSLKVVELVNKKHANPIVLNHAKESTIQLF
jgi:predicted nucleotidyltransferase